MAINHFKSCRTVYLDNRSVAILAKLNELADRHGLAPCDFFATFGSDDKGITHLNFDSPPEGEEKIARFRRMLTDMGIVVEDLALFGTDVQIYDAIAMALARAPARRISR